LPIGRLGEASGATAADATGDGHTATYGSSVVLAQPGALAGDTGTSVRLSASPYDVNAYVEAPDSPAFAWGTGSWSVELWANLPDYPSASHVAVLLGKNDRYVASNGWRVALIDVYGTGALYPSLFVGTDSQFLPFVGLGAYALNTPAYFAAGYDAAAGEFWMQLNGTRQAQSAAAVNMTNAIPLRVGFQSSDYNGYATDSYVQEVAVYDYALAAERVMSHYSCQRRRQIAQIQPV
jgi:hypothetical protein